MKEVIITARDGYKILLNIYEVENPKAVVQVAHGMEEHQGRYKEFAEKLNAAGYIVVSADMRGHGRLAKNYGYFKKKEGYNELVADHVKVANFIKTVYKDLPLYLFAHSMGSIIARVVLQKYSKKYDKVILSGYPNYRTAAKLGIILTDTLTAKYGAKFKTKLLTDLEFKFFNFMVWNPKTKVDWIAYNKAAIDEYLNDPLCGKGFTSSGFSDLFHLVVQMNKVKDYKNVNKNLKLLFIRGVNDVSTGGKFGSNHSVETMKKAGFTNITKYDYEHCRHEVIREVFKDRVFEDIVNFYDN